MGTWGTGYFEDDFARDYMSEIEESSNPKQKIKEAIQLALESDYIESDGGTAVVISATYIDAQVNGTKFSPDPEEPLEVDTFTNRNPNIVLSDLKSDVVKALKKIISGNSELNELWEETGEEYAEWKAGIEKLIENLSK